MSSTMFPISFHRLTASLTNTSQQLSLLPACHKFPTILTASCELINSQTPSLATIMNLSSPVIIWVVISGSEMTPTLWAILSPIDLDIASPGIGL